MKNIPGIFKVKIDGKEYKLKNNLGVTEDLENNYFKRPITEVMNQMYNGTPMTSDIINTIYLGIIAAGSKVKREEIGQKMFEEGMDNFMPICLEFLSYSIIGKETSELTFEKTDPKKK